MSARATRGKMDRQNLPAAAPWRQILACFRRRLAEKIVVFQMFPPRPRFCIVGCGASFSFSVTRAGVFHVVFRQRFERPKSLSAVAVAAAAGLSGVEQRAVRSDRVAVGGAGPRSRQRHRRNGTFQRVILDKQRGDVGQFIAAIRRANPADAVRHAGQRFQLAILGIAARRQRRPGRRKFVAAGATYQPGHHHHHHAGSANDGSTAAPTTATPADGSTSPGSTAGGANVANNNLLERLIQMQAQLINPTTVQNVATA